MTKDVTTLHETVVVRRTFEAPVARVFEAWSEPAILERWYVPGDDTWTGKALAHEFRRGGTKRIEFGPKEGPTYLEDCRYEDIVPERRICFVMTVLRDGLPITTSMVTVEFHARGAATELEVTDQLTILDGGDEVEARRDGWGETLDKLPGVL